MGLGLSTATASDLNPLEHANDFRAPSRVLDYVKEELLHMSKQCAFRQRVDGTAGKPRLLGPQHRRRQRLGLGLVLTDHSSDAGSATRIDSAGWSEPDRAIES